EEAGGARQGPHRRGDAPVVDRQPRGVALQVGSRATGVAVDGEVLVAGGVEDDEQDGGRGRGGRGTSQSVKSSGGWRDDGNCSRSDPQTGPPNRPPKVDADGRIHDPALPGLPRSGRWILRAIVPK